MAQIKFTADLAAAEYPLLTKFAGRTVMQGNLDGGTYQTNLNQIKMPQIQYCQNILPTKAGYKSVTYASTYAAASPINTTFSRVWTVTDSSLTRAKLAVTTNSRIYILSTAVGFWVDITPAGWAGGDAVTVAFAQGVTYIYLANFGCYTVSVSALTLTAQTLTAITAANITGCFEVLGYLCLFDNSHIYWCSTLSPTDFTPSLITGAGSSIPNDLAGVIVAVVPIPSGYIIYSTENIILAAFSNNTQFPWIFTPASGGSGISSVNQVSSSSNGNIDFSVAQTFAGILEVRNKGCTQTVPEVAEFLAALIYEAYDPINNIVVSTNLTKQLQTRIAVIGGRYIVLSYAIAGTVGFTDAIVRDIVLNRWGKLSTPHASVFEFDTAITSGASVYANTLNAYNTYTTVAYNQAGVGISSPPSIGNNFGLLGIDGSLSIAVFDDYIYNASSVLLLGKYQATRDYLLTLQSVDVETIDLDNAGFKLLDIVSIDGKDPAPAVALNQNSAGAELRTYGCRLAAKNHTLVFLGSFNLTTVEITAVLGSRR